MRALTWQGNEHVEVTDVPDPAIQEPNDIIIRVTSTAICGSDLHLYGVLGPFSSPVKCWVTNRWGSSRRPARILPTFGPGTGW
jgi:threonine dehydrogenase-like Zn-dependent dehydrogenase